MSQPSLNTVAKWLKLPWSWNVTVFSIPLTLERADIHKSARGWGSKITLKVLFYYHLCLSVACNTTVCPYTCSSIPLCSSNSTWQMERTRKKIKVSSKAKNMCSSQPWGLISVASPCGSLPYLFCSDCVPFHARRLQGLQPQKRSHGSSWSKAFCMPSFKHLAFSKVKPEVDMWRWQQEWSFTDFKFSFKIFLYHEWMDLGKCIEFLTKAWVQLQF